MADLIVSVVDGSMNFSLAFGRFEELFGSKEFGLRWGRLSVSILKISHDFSSGLSGQFIMTSQVAMAAPTGKEVRIDEIVIHERLAAVLI